MTALIEIAPYNAAWPDEYRRLAERIRAVAPRGSSLHHIGSTAVPGLAAKDVIDLQLSVDSIEEMDVSAFAAAGFGLGRRLSDHAPPGVSLAQEQLAKLLFKGLGRAANLHVRQRHHFNQRYPLLCRDFLRATPEAARAYEAVKVALAARFPKDAGSYYAVKDPVFDIIMSGAELWAAKESWSEPPED
jgi:GrpB-like predicted nucleotidyltransferase (UPF0157 family)